VLGEQLHGLDVLVGERTWLVPPLQVRDPERRIDADRGTDHGFDVSDAHAAAIAEARVEERRRCHDRASGRKGLGDDALRRRRADALDLVGGEAVADPPPRCTRALVVVQLEIALMSARDLHHERECVAEERLELRLRAEPEQAEMQRPLAPKPGQVDVAWLTGHASDLPQRTSGKLEPWGRCAERP